MFSNIHLGLIEGFAVNEPSPSLLTNPMIKGDIMFEITEDLLTNNIFHNSTLDATGTGTKLDARRQAIKMLAGPKLFDAANMAEIAEIVQETQKKLDATY